MALLHIHSAGMCAIERRSNTNPVHVHIMILVCTERKEHQIHPISFFTQGNTHNNSIKACRGIHN